MKDIESQLNSLLCKYSNAQRVNKYPIKVKELCVELTKSLGVTKASVRTGISKSAIYKWIKKGIYYPNKSSKLDQPISQRPLILQEVEITSAPSFQPLAEIRLISSNGLTAHLPVDDKTISILIGRMMEINS